MLKYVPYMQSHIVIDALFDLGIICPRLASHVASVLMKMDELLISECIVHFSEIDYAKTGLEVFINKIGANVTFSPVCANNDKCGASVYFGNQTVRALNISYFIAHQISIYEREILNDNNSTYNPVREGPIFSYVKKNISSQEALSLYDLNKQKKRLLEMIADIEKIENILGKLAIRGIVINDVIHCGIHIPSTMVPKEKKPKYEKKYEKVENILVRYIRYLEKSGNNISIAGDGNGAFPLIGEKLNYNFVGCTFITGFGAPKHLFTRDGIVIGVDGMVNDRRLQSTPLEILNDDAARTAIIFKQAYDNANKDVDNAQRSLSFKEFIKHHTTDHVMIWNRINGMHVIIASFLSESRLQATSEHWGP